MMILICILSFGIGIIIGFFYKGICDDINIEHKKTIENQQLQNRIYRMLFRDR